MEYFGHPLPEGWKKMVKKVFKEADTNKDGKLEPKEVLMHLFKLIDTDNDGGISLEELYDAIEAIAKFSKNTLIKDWKDHVKNAVSHIDTNDDGKGSAKEIWDAI